MNINLTKADRTNIQRRVGLVNEYFHSIWKSYETVMIIRRKNVKRNQDKEREILHLSRSNPNYDQNVQEIAYKDQFLEDGLINPDPIDVMSDSMENEVSNILPIQNDFRMDCNKTRDRYALGYREQLVSLIYGHLYQAYGKGIPDGLGHFLNFKNISKDAQNIFVDIDRWWNAKGNGQTIQNYTDQQNAAIQRKERQHYDDGAYDEMSHLLRFNDWERTSKKVLRFVTGGYYDGPNHEYRLGIPSINAFCYWLTEHYQIDIRSTQPEILYRDRPYQSGMNHFTDNPIINNIRLYKDGSYSINFKSAKRVDQVESILGQVKEQLTYEHYQHLIQKVPSVIKSLGKNISENWGITRLWNYNINLCMNLDTDGNEKVIRLVQRTLRRFHDEIRESLADIGMHDFNDIPTGSDLATIESYYQGIQYGRKAFTLSPYNDILSYLNQRDPARMNPEKKMPEVFRNLHRSIANLPRAYRVRDEKVINQIAGIDYVINLALAECPKVIEHNRKAFQEA